MATKPQIKTLTSSSVDILNAIRNYATTNYQQYVTITTLTPKVSAKSALSLYGWRDCF